MRYLHELLAETVSIPAAREEVLIGTLADAGFGARLGGSGTAWLADLDPTSRLVGGITHGELPFASDSPLAQVAQPRRLRAAATAQPPVHRDTHGPLAE